MENSNEINDLKTDINNLHVQLGVTSAQFQVLLSCFMEVVPAVCCEKHGNELYTKLVNEMEAQVKRAIDGVQPLLYDTGDHAFLTRQRFDAFETFQAMKQNHHYMNDEDCDNNAQ